MASKQHGLTTMNATRPKKKVRHRKNKASARKRKQALLNALEEAIAAARGEHTHKSPKKPAAKSEKKESSKKTSAKKTTTKASKSSSSKKTTAKKETKKEE